MGAAGDELRAAHEQAKEALDSHDDARIGAAHERLTKASHKAAEAMYAQQPGATQPDARAANDDGRDDDGVIDAEFEEKAS